MIGRVAPRLAGDGGTEGAGRDLSRLYGALRR